MNFQMLVQYSVIFLKFLFQFLSPKHVWNDVEWPRVHDEASAFQNKQAELTSHLLTKQHAIVFSSVVKVA